MYGIDMGTLNIIFLVEDTMEEINLWTRSGEIGDVWVVGEMDISDVESGWLIIEGIDGGSYRSDIAIDDIAITQCQVRGKPKS